MDLWASEIKELKTLCDSIRTSLPDLEKELSRLVKADDENMILLYSRRCLEVIVTDLCECELKRPRKTEPLKGIIDKLNKEGRVPSHIVTSMHGLNELSTYGAHPKDFDPEQIKPVLNNLSVIIKWYLKYRESSETIKTKPADETMQEVKLTGYAGKGIPAGRERYLLIGSISALFIVITVLILFITGLIGGGGKTRETEKSIAILPFKLLSNEPDKQYLADGIMEAILLHLSKIRDLRVLGSTTVERYRQSTKTIEEIGKELNVAYILEGNFQKYGDDAKLIVQLIRTRKESHLWSEEYNRNWNDILAVQSEVAQAVASELKAVITPEENKMIEAIPTSNLTAYDLYLRGNDYLKRGYMVEDNFRYAIQMFERAVEIDPEFALAYKGLAESYRNIFYFHGRNDEDLLNARKFLDKALSLSLDLKEVRLEEARYYSSGLRDYSKAVEILEKLIAEYPNDDEIYAWTGYQYRSLGDLRKSLEYTGKAISLNPSEWSYWQNESFTHWALREYDESELDLKESIALNPSYRDNYVSMFELYVKTGQIQKAEDYLAKNKKNIGDQNFKRYQAELLSLTKHYDRALQVLETLTEESIVGQHHLFTKHLLLGLNYRLVQNNELAIKHFDIERDFLMGRINETENDHRLYKSLGIALAGLDLKKEAIEAGRKALAIYNFEINPHQSIQTEIDFVRILVMVGEYDEAMEKLERIFNLHGHLTAEILKLDPFWDPVRDHPKFKAIISNPEYQVNLSGN